MKIKQTIFSGARPKAAITLLGPEEAQTAENCKLDKGDLRPWKQYSPVKSVAGLGTPRTLYRYQNAGVDNWIAKNDEYDFARSPVAGEAHNRLYYTGPNEPRVIASDIVSDPFDFDNDYYTLGVPAPASAPTIDAGYSTGDLYRAYVYSYVVRLGGSDLEEGPPSAFDSITDYGSGNVTLSGFKEPPSEREIGTIRIYRTNAATSGVSAFQFVGEFQTAGFNFSSDVFVDDVGEADLGTDGPQPETSVPPPTNLKGLIALLNGSFAGFVGNVVYISESNQPHAWPYEYPVDAEIVGLGWFGATGVVLTDTNVYLLIGAPEAMDVMKLDGNHPCLSKRGILSDIGQAGGVAFPSEQGWKMASQNGVTDLSKSFIDPTSWRDTFNPSTTQAVFYEGNIIATHSGGAYVIDFFNDRFTTLEVMPDAYHLSHGSGSLYFIKSNEDSGQPSYDHAIYLWEGDQNDFMQYDYLSKKFIMPYTANFTIARVIRSAAELATIETTVSDNDANAAANIAAMADGDINDAINDFEINFGEIHGDDLVTVLDLDISADITFKLYGDGILIHTETVMNDDPFRLPADVLYKKVEYELIGYAPVQEVAIATSADELDG